MRAITDNQSYKNHGTTGKYIQQDTFQWPIQEFIQPEKQKAAWQKEKHDFTSL